MSTIISASVYFNKQTLAGNLLITGHNRVPSFILCSGLITRLSSLSSLSAQLASNTQAAAGWALFLSLVFLLYQIFAISQLFFYVKLLYMKIPVGKTLWYLFPLIVRQC